MTFFFFSIFLHWKLTWQSDPIFIFNLFALKMTLLKCSPILFNSDLFAHTGESDLFFLQSFCTKNDLNTWPYFFVNRFLHWKMSIFFVRVQSFCTENVILFFFQSFCTKKWPNLSDSIFLSLIKWPKKWPYFFMKIFLKLKSFVYILFFLQSFCTKKLHPSLFV